MDCVEARRLLDQGVTPGARTSQSSQLGFHLARCADCRAYRDHNDSLLAALLLDAPVTTRVSHIHTSSATLGTPSRLPSDVVDAQLTSSKRLVSLGKAMRVVGSLAGIIVLVLLVWLGSILLRTWENVAAMTISSTALPQSTSERVQPSPEDAVLFSAPPLVTTRITEAVQNTATPAPSPSSLATVSASAITPATEQTPVITASMANTSTTPTAVASPSFIDVTTPAPTPELSGGNTTAAVQSGAPQEVPVSGDAVTILILGNDRRPGEAEIPRTDAIMLARINPQSGRIALLSLPRDLWVTIPGYGETRINAAYVWGEVYHADGGGLGLAKATLSQLTGVPIDYVVMADFQGFIGAIDSIGGITVTVDKTLDDPQFPTLDYGYTHAHFDAGPQQMDGITALTYSRIRHPDSDFARIKRQQAVMIGLGERLRERGDLQNLLAADRITGALRDYVRTDIPQDRLLGLVWALRAIDSSKVERFSVEPDMISFGIGTDRYAELLLPGALEDLMRRWYGQ